MNATFTLIMQRHNNRSGTNDFICYANDVIHKKKITLFVFEFHTSFSGTRQCGNKNELEY